MSSAFLNLPPNLTTRLRLSMANAGHLYISTPHIEKKRSNGITGGQSESLLVWVSGVFRLEALRLLFALAFGIQDKSSRSFWLLPRSYEREKKRQDSWEYFEGWKYWWKYHSSLNWDFQFNEINRQCRLNYLWIILRRFWLASLVAKEGNPINKKISHRSLNQFYRKEIGVTGQVGGIMVMPGLTRAW